MTASNATREEEISALAREIWEAEGRPDGRDKEHWARAEELHAARAGAEPAAGWTPDPTYVRPAGPRDMDMGPSTWSKTDEESDESFPASDPPGNY